MACAGNFIVFTALLLDGLEVISCSREEPSRDRRRLMELKKKKKPKLQHDPLWAKAMKVCRLNMEDIRMAKELGMSPRSLMKNVPGPTQQWKAPVRVWIRDLYEKRQQKAAIKKARRAASNAGEDVIG